MQVLHIPGAFYIKRKTGNVAVGAGGFPTVTWKKHGGPELAWAVAKTQAGVEAWAPA